jgi:FixJ family two-component response regulator
MRFILQIYTIHNRYHAHCKIAVARKLTRTTDEGVVHIIDDEPGIVNLATSILQNSGYKVHSFSDTSKALEDMALCNKKISMILTDIRMPGHNGFEIAREARAIVPDVPIVFLTGFEISRFEFQSMFPSLKGVNFLQKPFHKDKLLDTVKQYAKSRGQT